MEGRTIGIPLLLFLIAINVIVLDITISKQRTDNRENINSPKVSSAPSSFTCDETCKEVIAAEVKRQSTIPKPSPGQAPTRVSAPVGAKEYYIPLGSGKTQNDQWEEIPSAEVYIDSTKYPGTKTVTFESYLRVPSGVGWVYAKLYNATDKHDVWTSEVKSESSVSTRREATIQLDSGNKLYRVLMKSTIRAEALIDNARIKIIAQ